MSDVHKRYRHVLGQNLGWLDDIARANEGVHWMMASLFSGAGLRLVERL